LFEHSGELVGLELFVVDEVGIDNAAEIAFEGIKRIHGEFGEVLVGGFEGNGQSFVVVEIDAFDFGDGAIIDVAVFKDSVVFFLDALEVSIFDQIANFPFAVVDEK
jgi:hypothetical protein